MSAFGAGRVYGGAVAYSYNPATSGGSVLAAWYWYRQHVAGGMTGASS